VPEISAQLSAAGESVEVFLEPNTNRFIGRAAFADPASVVSSPTRRPEAILFAPATTTTLARLAHGFDGGPTDELYSGGLRPAFIAPDLEPETASHPAVVKNLRILREDGCVVVGESGFASVAEVSSAILGGLGGPLAGLRVVVTVGGTREIIDSVRFIGNRSSGKMGLAVAREARRLGAEVVVVAANVEVVDSGVEVHRVESVKELREATLRLVEGADALVMAAAVSDFTPAKVAESKIRRRDGMTLEMISTEDVLGEVRRRNPDLFVIGFAASHGDPRPDAREKLRSKGADLFVGNDISRPGTGFGADENEVYIVDDGAERFVPRASKAEVARAILDSMKTKMQKRGCG
jgi:phosphopantothenoylcysteine decarboxylase/phosphopantothenate--cysteine ligase